MSAEPICGADIVIRALVDQGVDVVFGYPGGAVLPIYDSLFKQNALRHILVRQEGGAVHAAEGYARSTGKVGVVLHKPGGTSTTLREQGFDATMAAEFPGVKIAARQFGMADRAKAREAAENMLTAHPDMAGMFASSEASSLGAILAITVRGLSGKVKLITFDTSEAHVAALKAGTIDVMLVQDSYRIGYEAVKSLADEHVAEVLNYLKVTGIRVGLLVNFGAPKSRVQALRS